MKYLNRYTCNHAGTAYAGMEIESWSSSWGCRRCDLCPTCGTQRMPYCSEEIKENVDDKQSA